MSVYVLALLIGVVAGLRAMTAPAVVSWQLLAECIWKARGLSSLALAELVTDQLPKTPSRKVPLQFGARIVTGALCGTALGASGGIWIGGLVAGVIGRRRRTTRRLRVPDKADGDDRRQRPSNRTP